ncbi:MAG: sulfatase-like hydrolase/transferase [Sandaracinaceae bacterium]|nr:sulfatase-like hydrolase/transferase [Sandaracinaceae bacterium]
MAQGPWTFSSVPSIVTSRAPQAHYDTVLSEAPATVLGEGSATFAEVLREAGFTTSFVSGHGAIGAIVDLCRGFDRCEIEYERASEVTDRAIAALDAAPRGPHLLWVYYIDPHVPYEAPEEHLHRFLDDGLVTTGLAADPSEHLFVGYERIPRAAFVEGVRELDWYVANYDAEISFVDAQIGRLRRALEARGRADAAWLVFADHGESLTEHGLYLSHTVHLSDVILRIPGSCAGRAASPPGRASTRRPWRSISRRRCSGCWGSQRRRAGRGTTRARACAARRRARAATPTRSGAARRASRSRSGAARGRSAAAPTSPCAASITSPTIPGESHDLCAEQAERCAELRAAALAWHEAQPPVRVAPERTGDIDPELLRALVALGYVSVGGP